MDFGRPAGSARPAIRMVMIAALLDMMAMGIVLPVLPGLIERLTGSPAAAGIWTGIVASLFAGMQLLCAPVLGALSDRFGRRPVILISTAGLALDWIVMALAPSLWWLVLGRLVGGITSASGTALFACVADITAPEQRARAFGLVGAAVSAGFVAGPALGGLLSAFGPRTPFWIAAAFSAAAFLYGLLVLPETLPAERRVAFEWRRAHPIAGFALLRSTRAVAGLAASGFLLTFVHRLFMTVFVLFVGHRFGWGPFAIGLLLTFSSTLDLILQGVLVGPVVTRIGERCTIVGGLAAGAAGLLAMGLASSPAWFVAAMTVNALWGLAEPTIRAAMSRRVADAEQGRLQGAIQSLAGVAGIAGPVFFGWIYGASSGSMPALSFVVAAVIVALAACCGLAADPGSAPRDAG